MVHAERRTHPVGLKLPNAWGLYDMHGNVWEWCQDCFVDGYYTTSPRDDPPGALVGPYRALRGGCWYFVEAGGAASCRAAFRNRRGPPSLRIYGLGFRLARSVPSSSTSP